MVNKKTNDEEEVKSIPCFETKIKESNKSLHNPEFKKNEFSPKLFSPSFSKLKSEDLVIKNQDTGERFYIDDINQVAKLQEQGKTAEYLEKLKKRKKEEIWQDWWTEKKKINQELMTAIKSNNIAMVKKLFEENQDDKKPEINSKDEKDWTCLHFACLSGNYDMVLELIKLEAEIDSQTNLKQTPLIIAAQKF
jgi:ankyrin repeat protein